MGVYYSFYGPSIIFALLRCNQGPKRGGDSGQGIGRETDYGGARRGGG